MLINSAAYEDGSKVGDPGLDGIGDFTERPGGFVWWRFKRSGWL
jgi:hypothetical protein